jgi:hypothetical protein
MLSAICFFRQAAGDAVLAVASKDFAHKPPPGRRNPAKSPGAAAPAGET